MFSWVRHDGFDWQLIEPPEGNARSGRPRHLLGVTFGYGVADEPLTEFGSLRCAAAVIRAELRRPIELRGGGVSTPEVEALVGPDTTTFTIAGDIDELAAAWRGLAALFAEPRIEQDQRPLPGNGAPWPVDLTARYGLTGLSLAAIDDVTADLTHAALRQLAELDPSAGQVRSTFFTTAEQLLGAGSGSAEAGFVAPAEPAGPRRPFVSAAPCRGSLPAPNDQVFLSTTLPSSLAGLTAARLILARSQTTFEATSATGRAVFLNLVGMRAEQYLVLGNSSVEAQHDLDRTVSLLVDNLAAASDEQIETELLTVSMDIESGWARRVRTLGLTDEPPTTAGVRDALQAASENLHLALSADRPAPDSFPLLLEPLPAEKGTLFHSWGQQRTIGGYSRAVADVRIGPRTLTTYANTVVNGRKVRTQLQQVDLADSGLVITDPAGGITIVDRSLRSVDLMVSGFRRSTTLQRQLDDRLGNVTVLHVATTPLDLEAHRRALRRAKRLWVFAFVAPILVLAMLIGAAVAQHLASDDPIDYATSVGETAKLSNGTLITVTEVDPVVHDDTTTVRIHVRFCAGKDTDADDAPADVRRRVSPSDFAFSDGSSVGRRTTTSTELPRRTVTKDTCVEGDVAFQLSNYRGGQDQVAYHNEVGDQIRWRQ